MITKEQVRALLADIESDRVERTESTTDTNKFCEAICAFANDMPDSKQPGYLLLGAEDKTGNIVGINVTDDLLLKLSNYADSGQIVPLPSLVVQKFSFDDGDVAVVEVKPSDTPPVRYRGRTWIRRGPRKAIANEQEERILTERRVHNARTFDLRPCRGCNADHMVFSLFELDYRTAAIAPEIIEENDRDMLQQMASLRLWNTGENCATNAGALLFSESPVNWFPGAYVQYVHFDGDGLESEVIEERRFDGAMITMLRELDAFLKTLFPSRPVPVSPLKEEQRGPYPVWAIRELLMNAIMHRDYESTADVRFYRFSNRIEMQNPGGLYGAATPENFPNQNAYRNPEIAEALKTLGYVNRFGSGVARAQAALKTNGNPTAEFDTSQTTYFLATVSEAPYS